ncbi:MAG TPA: heavy metal-associated domain-containing protein [Trueperaceae bacterium]|jgi:Cu+-exporting ATPase
MTRTATITISEETPMHCQGCEERIGSALKRLPGVEAVQASRETQEVSVTFDPERITVSQVRERLASAGFEPEGT